MSTIKTDSGVIFKLKANGDGSASVVDADGVPLQYVVGDDDDLEDVVIPAAALPTPPAAAATEPAPTPQPPSPSRPAADGPLTEDQVAATLATSRDGQALLADPAKLAGYMAQLRADGLVGVAAGASAPDPTTGRDDVLSEDQFRAVLATTEDGRAVLAAAGRYQKHLAAARAAGDVA